MRTAIKRAITFTFRCSLSLLVFLLAWSAPRAQQCDYEATEFNQANWTHLVLVNTNTTAHHTESQETTGGNPGTYQHGSASFPETTHYYTAHLADAAVWDRSSSGLRAMDETTVTRRTSTVTAIRCTRSLWAR